MENKPSYLGLELGSLILFPMTLTVMLSMPPLDIVQLLCLSSANTIVLYKQVYESGFL